MPKNRANDVARSIDIAVAVRVPVTVVDVLQVVEVDHRDGKGNLVFVHVLVGVLENHVYRVSAMVFRNTYGRREPFPGVPRIVALRFVELLSCLLNENMTVFLV